MLGAVPGTSCTISNLVLVAAQGGRNSHPHFTHGETQKGETTQAGFESSMKPKSALQKSGLDEK